MQVFFFFFFLLKTTSRNTSMYAEDFLEPSPSVGAAAMSSTAVDSQYFSSYEDLSVHRVMYDDEPRMHFYHSVLSDRSVMEGKVVMDVGAGTGLLSLWAVLHGGASHCLSIEASSLADRVIAPLVASKGLQRRVSVIAEPVEDLVARGVEAFLQAFPNVVAAGGVDYVVSEWMGFYLVHECMLASVVRARDFCRRVNTAIAAAVQPASTAVKPVVMVPDQAAVFAAPVTLDPWVERHAAYWTDACSRSGSSPRIDLSLVGRMEAEAKLRSANPLVDVIPEACLLVDGGDANHLEILRWDLNSVSVDDVTNIKTSPAAFKVARSAAAAVAEERWEAETVALHGIVLWFDVSSTTHSTTRTLSTSPRCPSTHWKHSVMLLPPELGWEGNAVQMPLGEAVTVVVDMTRTDDSRRSYQLSFELC